MQAARAFGGIVAAAGVALFFAMPVLIVYHGPYWTFSVFPSILMISAGLVLVNRGGGRVPEGKAPEEVQETGSQREEPSAPSGQGYGNGYCPGCGAPLSVGDVYCGVCGRRLRCPTGS